MGWLMRAHVDFLIQLGLPDQALAEAERQASFPETKGLLKKAEELRSSLVPPVSS